MEYWISRLTIAGVLVAGGLLAVLAATWAVEGSYALLAGLVVALVIATTFGLLNQNFWLIIPLTISMPGAFNFLPIPFSYLELAILLVVCQFVINRVVLEKRGIMVGPMLFVIPLVAFCLIVAYHWFIGGTGLRLFGGDTFGARRNFAIMLALAAFFVISNAPIKQSPFIRWVPALFLVGVVLGTLPFIFTSYFPSTAPYVNYFLGNINIEAYREFETDTIVGADDDLGRIGQLGLLGGAILICLVAYYPVKDWWRPNRWWVGLLALFSLYLVMRGGFRSALFHFVVVGMVAAWLSLRWRSVFPALVGGLILVVLSQLHGNMIQLPIAVQRTISFLPGDWHPTVVRGVESSNDFRAQIHKVYVQEEFWVSPWFGNGFAVDRREVEQAAQKGIDFHGQMDPIRAFIVRKDFHVGWISLYDCVGFVGCAFFAWMIGAMVWLFYKARWALTERNTAPIYIFLLCLFTKEILGYFVVFGGIHAIMPTLTVTAGMLVALGKGPDRARTEPAQEIEVRSPREQRELVHA